MLLNFVEVRMLVLATYVPTTKAGQLTASLADALLGLKIMVGRDTTAPKAWGGGLRAFRTTHASWCCDASPIVAKACARCECVLIGQPNGSTLLNFERMPSGPVNPLLNGDLGWKDNHLLCEITGDQQTSVRNQTHCRSWLDERDFVAGEDLRVRYTHSARA